MINVIKHGVKPEDQRLIYIYECPSCGCKFEFELEDCIYVEKCLDGRVGFKCPECNKSFDVKRNILMHRAATQEGSING